MIGCRGLIMTKRLSFSDAAEKVLREYANKKPMHYKEITRIALKKGWISTKGLTPEATMTAVIGAENRRRIARGIEPRFTIHGKGYYGLTEWQPPRLLREIRAKNNKVKEDLLTRLKNMDNHAFEELIGKFLTELGFENVEVTSRSSDGGIDVRGELVVGGVIRTRMAVQVKRWKHNVQTPVVTQLRGSLGPHEQGLIVTTSDFSKGARKEAANPYKTPIALMNGKQLVDLMVELGIGVNKESVSLLELKEEDFISESEKTRQGTLTDKEGLQIYGKYKGKKFQATYYNPKKIVFAGQEFDSPSAAAKASCKVRSINGWLFWKYKDNTGKEKPLDSLRKANIP